MPQYNCIDTFNIKQLLSDNASYIIPIYQRNYAWGAKEIEQLIQDIIDFYKEHKNKNYYIGTLVVAKNKSGNSFDTIDGQQRLTTLHIINSVIKNKFTNIDVKWYNEMNIHFHSRKKSKRTLDAVFNGDFPENEYEPNIIAAYKLCENEIQKKISENKISINEFVEYINEYVTILRVSLPDNIDLNHYFEIMNSRGEQLEKHEILKAQLMSFFQNSEKSRIYGHCFSLIWEACSNIERYVQYGFTPTQRHQLFSENDWNDLNVESFDEIVNKLFVNEEFLTLNTELEKDEYLIDEIIKLPKLDNSTKQQDELPDRFNSVINFQNFLLHVLRLQVDVDKVSLDDKRILDIFNAYIPSDTEAKEEFAKTFIYNLLKTKFLFDKYIIKREFTANTDRWALKSLKWYSSGNTKNGVKYVNTFGAEEDENYESDNRRVLMLLSMFHVSIPSQSYKYWLNAALRYVFHHEEVKPKDYIEYLEHIAKSFVFDKYLSANPLEYYQMINQNLYPINRNFKDVDKNKLRYSSIENNLIFNFCDYLLWQNEKSKNQKIKVFEYTFRSSVEHYYPQNPINKDLDIIDEEHLHSFGNLCLISHEKNSKLNNFSPKAKKEHYSKSSAIDSVKQYLMMDDKWGDWHIKQISEHETDMITLLSENINSEYTWTNNKTSKARLWFKRYKNENKQLLVRVLMCFGRIDFENGWTSGIQKWNFYQWDNIESSTAFQKFEQFVNENNPTSLEEIIQYHLNNSEELKVDSYRYAFVSRPEIIDYCELGNFGWANEGKRVLLMTSTKANLYNACDLYCFTLKDFIKKKYNVDTYCGVEKLYISIQFEEQNISITNINWALKVFIVVWNDNNGKVCYELETKNIHGNSRIIQNLLNSNWSYNNDGKLYFSEKPYLVKLTDDVEKNIKKTEEAFQYILKKLLK